ncbi:phosphotransferase [Streptomyces mirabilis]|uniref:phosphotransferase n=1 Tax=Streptomyces mirabilis TaxID=68239 RepID=UPI0037244359
MASSSVQLSTNDLQLGSYGAAAVRPNSITRWALDGSSLLKIYRNIAPRERRLRELTALQIAADWGLSVPPVLASGEDDDSAWTVLGTLPGKPCSIDTPRAVQDFVRHAVTATLLVHRKVDGAHAGQGWERQSEPTTSNRNFLLDQFSARCQKLPWWRDLKAVLAPYNEHPTVYLHCDLKPEYLLVDGDRLHIVDWEASGRGPAVSDQADATFHLVRDLIYTPATPLPAPIGIISQLGASGPALAWRLALWLDRRRPGDIHLLPERELLQLASEDDPVAACEELTRLVSNLREAGVPR